MPTYRALDFGLDLARLASPPVDLDELIEPQGHWWNWIFLEGVQAWSAAPHALAFAGLGGCPIQHGGRGRWYCLGCDRTGLDGRVEFPGLDVDEAPNIEYGATPTVLEPSPLAGGIGRKRIKGALKKGA